MTNNTYEMKITLSNGEEKSFFEKAESKDEAEQKFISNIDSWVYEDFVRGDENAKYALV